ncbi:hypothetical protein [Micromonospora craterilacus]|uniref:hypothetical protein n=1 Tax=Micromonospora craterilacus TaxID=1655439 RepID=UPI001314DCFD|nr:hypothetical protein [Micromonospora craterilacus]
MKVATPHNSTEAQLIGYATRLAEAYKLTTSSLAKARITRLYAGVVERLGYDPIS